MCRWTNRCAAIAVAACCIVGHPAVSSTSVGATMAYRREAISSIDGSRSSTADAVPPLPDTSANIHVGLTFNYHVSNPALETGMVDLVWASTYPSRPPGMYNTVYEHFDLEPTYWDAPNRVVHDLAWFRANHPDWIEYTCDRATPAYEFGMSNVPLDITNPAVLTYLFQTYYAPMLQKGYQGIAFDNVNLSNALGARCGVYSSSGQWIQQFTGRTGDPAYHSAILQWARWMYARVHGLNRSVGMNFSFDFDDPADSTTLYQYLDLVFDERGFTNWGTAGANYLAGADWLLNMQALQALVQHGKGILSSNQEPGTFRHITAAEKEWILANYLLVKGQHSWIYMCGEQEYGYMFMIPEYAAPIGVATNPLYSLQNVYMRDFTNGKAIVNPSPSQSNAITLPRNTYTDLRGNAVNNLTLPPASGIVLLGHAAAGIATSSQRSPAMPWAVVALVGVALGLLTARLTRRWRYLTRGARSS